MAKQEMTTRQATSPATVEREPQAAVFVPRVDIVESEKELVLIADMPGVDETSVSVNLEGSVLTVTGKTGNEVPAGHSLTYQEYTTGDYERSFTLGETIDREGIKAAVKAGVLQLTLPKAKAAQPRRIPVQVG